MRNFQQENGLSLLSVRSSFKDKSILITGANGFVGKVLVEKFLRDVPKVKKIFIFMRTKRGQTVQERFQIFKSSQVFQRVKVENPSAIDKVVPIEVDFTNPLHLGLAGEALEILTNEVSFVFHLAASVKFDDTIDEAVRANVMVTKTLVQMSKLFVKLETFLYVSSIASIHKNEVQNETIHQSIFDFREVLDIVENGNDADIEILSRKALKKFPNTYGFTKHLAEQLILSESINMPMVVMRAPLVTPCASEPMEGWVDFRGTIIGIQLALMFGVLRSIYGIESTKLINIPCDLLVNAIIVAAADMAKGEKKTIKVFNCAIKKYKMKLGEMLKLALINTTEACPSELMLWYPRCTVYKNYFLYALNFVLFQFIPAMVIDAIGWIIRRPARLVKLQMRIFLTMKSFTFYTTNQIQFDTAQLSLMKNHLNDQEK